MGKQLFVYLLALGFALSACQSGGGKPTEDACDYLDLESRIANGSQCEEANSPVAELTMLYSKGSIALCSGTLIKANKILTTGHCFQDDQKLGSVTSVVARVGGIDIPVTGYQVHPQYLFPQNDVAIATLSTPSSIRPVPLVVSVSLQPGDRIGIFGYGLNEDENSGALRSGEMDVTGVNSQFIQAHFEDDGSNVCAGDSGGPAIFSFTDAHGNAVFGIVGIISFGSAKICGENGIAGFTNTQGSSILSFITSVVPDVPVI